MGQALIRKLSDDTLADYRGLARARGTSLEAELREIIEANRPFRKKSAVELRRMSDDALCARLPDLFPPTVKSARSRLSNARILIDTGERIVNARNRRMIVWAAPEFVYAAVVPLAGERL